MDLLQLLAAKGVVLLDGAMGTQLDRRGLMSRGRTMKGDTAGQCAEQLAEAGAEVIGANCGDLDPLQMARVVALLRSVTDRPIVAQPNAGRPRLVDDRTVFDMEPAPFAEGMAECIRAGARLVGGCCSTSPEHIRMVRSTWERCNRYG